MQSDQIREDLLNFLASNFLVERDDIDLNKSLVDEGVIDSLGLIEISAHLERTHGIKIEVPEMNPQNFGSVNRIVDFVARKHAA
jgi:acyl carrier protein